MNRVKQLREARGLTRGDLEAIVGISRSTQWRYEQAGYQPNEFYTIVLSDYYGVSQAYLLGEDDES